jgi:hypothetical protein
MSLTIDGKAALKAILEREDLFNRVKPADVSQAAVKLAKKQLNAAGQGKDDLLALKAALGDDVFEKCLDTLTAHQVKLLARRLDPSAEDIQVNTGSSALRHVRAILSGSVTASAAPPEALKATETAPKKNKYLGRKAFRTGR